MMIKAIETRYKGYRFRSRLEARWAVFFDALGIEWEYEKEGFDLGELGRYLPDFWLPQSNTWAEVKHANFVMNDNDEKVFAAISSHFKSPIVIISGSPGIEVEQGLAFQAFTLTVIAGYRHDGWALPNCYRNLTFREIEDDMCLQDWLSTSEENPVTPELARRVSLLDVHKDEDRQVLYQIYGDYLKAHNHKLPLTRSDICSFSYDEELLMNMSSYNIASPSVIDALSEARSARFEFGESGHIRSEPKPTISRDRRISIQDALKKALELLDV